MILLILIKCVLIQSVLFSLYHSLTWSIDPININIATHGFGIFPQKTTTTNNIIIYPPMEHITNKHQYYHNKSTRDKDRRCII